MRALWIADAHLSDPDSKPYRALLELLERSPREIDTLVLLGDLFEVWLGDHPALLARHRTLLNVLAGVRALGKDIFYLKGNHDFLLGKTIQDEVGAQIPGDEAVFSWDGYRFIASHGDQINKRDRGYQILRTLLRGPWTEKLLTFIGPSASLWTARTVARFAGGTPDPRAVRAARAAHLRYARTRLRGPVDAVLLGHSHVVEWRVLTVRGKKKLYLNPGSWADSQTYVQYLPGRFRLLKYRENLSEVLFDFAFCLE